MKPGIYLLVAAVCAFSSAGYCESPSQTSLTVPGREIPVPDTVSPQMRKLIERKSPPQKTTQEWLKIFQDTKPKRTSEQNAEYAKGLAELRQRYDVKVENVQIGGVNCYVVTPAEIPASNKNRLLVHVHGGGYVYSGGEFATEEAIMVAGATHIKTISIDYRMPPKSPFPAAVDDAITVWKELSKTTRPSRMAIFGTSAGGGLTLAVVQRAIRDGLPTPAAIAPATPWSDLSKTGDSYFTNAYIDTWLQTYEGFLEAAARLYANGRDLKDPLLSPVYGQFNGFPPTFLTSGTRDLFLSNTVRVQQKLLEAGVKTELLIFEGQSHGNTLDDIEPQTGQKVPETTLYLKELTKFFDNNLEK